MSSSTDVQYQEAKAEGAEYLERFSPDHLRRLALEQADENAADAAHVEKVRDLARRLRDGQLTNTVDFDELRSRLLG